MIRRRRAVQDDDRLIRIIQSELLPYTRKVFPDIKVTKKMITTRLNEGVTYVAAHRSGTAEQAEAAPAIGFITLLMKDKVLYIDMLAVDSRHKRQGWGTLLMNKAEQFGKRNKCAESVLLVDERNWKAQRFYEKHGYSFSRYLQNVQCYLYSKALG